MWWWGPTYCLDPAGQKPHLGDLPDQDIVLEVQEGGAPDMLCKAPSEAWPGVNVVSGLGCLLLLECRATQLVNQAHSCGVLLCLDQSH